MSEVVILIKSCFVTEACYLFNGGGLLEGAWSC